MQRSPLSFPSIGSHQQAELWNFLEKFIADCALGHGEVNDQLATGSRMIGQALGTEEIVLYKSMKKPDETILEPKILWSLSESRKHSGKLLQLSMERSGITRWRDVLASGMVLTCDATDVSQDEQTFLARWQLTSAMAIPVFVHGTWWGFLLTGDQVPERSWDESAVWFSRIIANVFGLLLRLEHSRAAGTRHEEEQFELTRTRDSVLRENAELKHWKEHVFNTFMNDFRTPVNTLVGFATTLRDNETMQRDTEVRTVCIENIFTQTRQLEKLLQRLIFLAQTQYVVSAREFHPVDLRFLLMELSSLFEQRAKKQGIECSFRISEKPIIVESEQSLLRQTLFNLLDNSLQDTPAYGWLNVQTDSSDEDIIIRITHSLKKLASHQPSYPFEKKSTLLQNELSESYLSIARRVVDLHHGSLRFDSDGSVGTILTISLPKVIK